MKKSPLILFTVLLLSLKTFAVTDTLRFYDPKKISSPGYQSYNYYPFASYPTQFARFDLKAPGNLTSVRIRWGGGLGSIKMHIYGQEGGAPSPQLMKDIAPSVTLTKTTAGAKLYTYTFANPIYLDNNQFFLGFDSISSGSTLEIGAVGTLGDSLKPVPCVSSTGGDFYTQWIMDTGGNVGYDIYSWFIDAVIDEPETVSPNYLKDVTSAAGISTSLSNWSVAWGDYDADGYQDLLVTGKLYRNKGDGTFIDMTSSAGMNVVGGQVTNGFVDMNNDGKLDIVCLGGTTNNYVFINNGGGSFTTQALNNMPNYIDISSLNFGDINKDNYPDMFTGQLWNGYPNPLPAYFYYNDKSNGFKDSSKTFNFDPTGKDSLHARGSSFVDFDNDGDLDLYIARYYLKRDLFFRNNGDGTFTDISPSKGLDINIYGYSGHGTGVDWADYDNDGDQDLFLPQLCHQANMIMADARPTTIYNNTGAPNYDFVDTYDPSQFSSKIGVEYEETHAGAAWGDINADGLQDFAICTFYGCRFGDIYIQQPDHTFKLKTFDYISTEISTADDMCWADYDNDGKLDLAFADNGIFKLFKNTSPTGNFIELDASSTTANKFAIGSHVTVYAGGQQYMQEVRAGKGDRQQNPYRLFFGLGSTSTIDSVVVKWPNNNKDKYTGLMVNRNYKLVEGGTSILAVVENKEVASDLKVYPNPFTNETTFNYNLDQNTTLKLEVYSSLGQLVAVLQDGLQSKGLHTINWNGTSSSGQQLPEGIYIYKLSGDNSSKTGKLVIQR